MSDHRQSITAILQQWREMTRAETQAIQSSNWPALRQIQEFKAKLRPPLDQAVEQWRAENSAPSANQPLRAEVGELLALATQNANLLAARKQRALERKRLMEQARFNLRRVRTSYAAQERVVLNSYS